MSSHQRREVTPKGEIMPTILPGTRHLVVRTRCAVFLWWSAAFVFIYESKTRGGAILWTYIASFRASVLALVRVGVGGDEALVAPARTSNSLSWLRQEAHTGVLAAPASATLDPDNNALLFHVSNR